MFRFDREQKVFEVGGVKFGGQPGEYPTVLIGSIFYDGHKIVSDANRGEFDKAGAEDLVKEVETLSDKTANPHIFDVVANTEEALIRYIDFIADTTEAPFLVDASSSDVRLPAIKHVFEIGLIDRAIYNSIDYHYKEDEIRRLKELGVKSSMIMGFNPTNLLPKGRIEILMGIGEKKGLLEVASEAGITNTLVDTAVLDVPSIGLAAKAVYLVKSELGLPAGCGPANAVTTWKRVKKEYSHGYEVCSAGSDITTILMGADFVLYGPIEDAEFVFPACAMTDALIAYQAKFSGIRVKTSAHPLHKIF